MLGLKHQSLQRPCRLYISLFNRSRNIILRRIKELGEEDVLENRNRKIDGGRSPVFVKNPDINTVILQLLKEHT